MKPINNWNEVQPIMGGESQALPAGGYVCRVTAVKEDVSKASNKEMLVVNFDIAEGDYKDYYMNKYKNSTPKNDMEPIKWKGVYYITLEGENWEGRFKGFITALEQSNSGFQWNTCNWDTNRLVGLLFGGLFREEEFEGDRGVGKTTKLCWVRSAQEIREGNFEVPAPKPLNSANAPFIPGENNQVFDDDLPF